MKQLKGSLFVVALIGALAISACGGTSSSTPKTKNAVLVWCYNNASTIDIDAPNAAGTSWSIRQLANITRDYYESSRNRYSWANNETVINDLYGPTISLVSSCEPPTTVASASTTSAPKNQSTTTIPPIEITATTQVANVSQDIVQSLSESVNKPNVVVPATATQITCAAECVAAALASAGVSDGGTVYVSINGGPKQKLSATEANKIAVGSAKSMTFSVVDSKGKETAIAVPLDRGDTPAAVPATSTANGDSSGSGTTIAIVLVIALVVLGAGFTVIRRRKTTI